MTAGDMLHSVALWLLLLTRLRGVLDASAELSVLALLSHASTVDCMLKGVRSVAERR